MSSSHRLLQQIKKPSLDPIFSLISEFQRDTRKYKVDLGIGVYRDEFGKTPIMKSVQDAQQILIEKQDSKSYLSLTGNTEFNQASLELLLLSTLSETVLERSRHQAEVAHITCSRNYSGIRQSQLQFGYLNKDIRTILSP